MEKKYIYEFTAYVDKDVPKAETTTVDGVTTTVTTTVKERVPHYFAFKKPSRAEREDAEAFRASAWRKYVEKGLFPEAILLKTYENYGGILSESQNKAYREMRADTVLKMQDYQLAHIAKDEEKAKVIMNEIMGLRDSIVTFEREQSAFFENTAEAKARNKLIEYLMLWMSYHREDPSKPYAPYFDGADLDAKYVQLETREDSEDPLYSKARDRLAFVASLFVALNGNVTKQDVDEYTKEWAEEASAQPA